MRARRLACVLLTTGLMRLALTCVLLFAGCDLYLDDDEPPCALTGAEGASAATYRNPETGACDLYGYGGCDNQCGPCPGGDLVGIPDLAACYSACEELSEQQCLSTAGCYATYDVDGAPGAFGPVFWTCHPTAPSGPIHGLCSGLSAAECSRHDDCSLQYDDVINTDPQYGSGRFERCVPERVDTNDCSLLDCGEGYHCEQQCVECCPACDCADETTCKAACVPDQVTCPLPCANGYECREVCDDAMCYGTCVPTGGGDPGSCFGDIMCRALPPACPSGTTPGQTMGCWTGYCIPSSACGPNDPGSCYGDVICLTGEPACPSGTRAGIANGCWTGYCIPDGQCESAPCAMIDNEPACRARLDCTPVFEGDQCVCDDTFEGGCTCEVWTFDHCQ